MTSFPKIASLKSVTQFQQHAASLRFPIAADDSIELGASSPLLRPIAWRGRTIGNRIAVQPMEGWDGTSTGGATEPMRRRWARFGESGAKLIWGGEAMAVRPDGRANPHQLILNSENAQDIRALLAALRERHREWYGSDEDLVVGFQLTHSGRFCRPRDHNRWEPRIAHRHPLLDSRFGQPSDSQLLTAAELRVLAEDYVRAAETAHRIGADFVDIKCCHGYLLHEFLGAHTRDDAYGGSLENRARLILEILTGIRSACPDLGLGVRLSAFDMVPFEPDPALAQGHRLGPGRPCEHSHLLPYRWAFGVDPWDPCRMDLAEPMRLIEWLKAAGVTLINISAGSPYYTPHLLRPAAFPPSDGYQPHEDPLESVGRHLKATRAIKEAQPDLLVLGSGYSYLQEYLPHVAQHQVRQGWTDMIGLGRTVLSYPNVMMDAIQRGTSQRKLVCRTFSDCTTAPRNGIASGCYPLDDYYKRTPEAEQVKRIKSEF